VKVRYKEHFQKDLSKINDKALLKRVLKVIESVKNCSSFNGIQSVTKLKGSSNAYRIRVSDFRIGIKIEGDTVDFYRCLNRMDIYKYFP
jgi:mRNA interferase RelE/StbE